MRFTRDTKYPYTLDFTVHCPRDRRALYAMQLVFDRGTSISSQYMDIFLETVK